MAVAVGPAVCGYVGEGVARAAADATAVHDGHALVALIITEKQQGEHAMPWSGPVGEAETETATEDPHWGRPRAGSAESEAAASCPLQWRPPQA